MSYPEPRYLGEKGEINAVFRPADTPPDIVSPGGTTTHYLASHASTGGEFGLYKVDMGPKAPGAKTHFHRAISESFYVLSGEVKLYNGERWVTGRQGDFLYVPVGGLHAFKNDSDDPLSMLMLFSPGAPREEYFEQVADFARRGGEELREFQVRHDSFFVGD
ncbi:quercetin dioxygenase-like cupin family protein [Streptomyces sp. BK208]|uniref:cupin domain-containing protein n=1 Tax=Streptomyces sp. BK208 TaxID=2512150 RepID=UPI00105EA101|nr:cupin domain-containing protein [Streptomyces sp. BK208]TDT41114.1 quercetin dioxygenase-like cupin family protein [Streptomyces sp. BK208]